MQARDREGGTKQEIKWIIWTEMNSNGFNRSVKIDILKRKHILLSYRNDSADIQLLSTPGLEFPVTYILPLPRWLKTIPALVINK